MRQSTQLKVELKANRRGFWVRGMKTGFGVESLSWWFGAGKFSGRLKPVFLPLNTKVLLIESYLKFPLYAFLKGEMFLSSFTHCAFI